MLIPLFEQEGFIICFEAHEEDISMRRHFIKECGWTEAEYRTIKNCTWFCAEVSAWKDGKNWAMTTLARAAIRPKRSSIPNTRTTTSPT